MRPHILAAGLAAAAFLSGCADTGQPAREAQDIVVAGGSTTRADPPAQAVADASMAPRLYVTSGLTDEVWRLDPWTGEVQAIIDVNYRRDDLDEPHGVVVSPDGRHWYMTLAHGNPTVWKYELPDDRLIGRLRLGATGASRIGLTPEGGRAFVPDYNRAGEGAIGTVAVIDLHDLDLVARLDVCAAPHDAQASPDGALVAIACSLSDEVVILDARTLEETGRFHVGDDPGPPGSPRYKPLNLVWSEDGRAIHVALHMAGVIRSFDATGQILADVEVGAGPAQLALVPGGGALVSANRLDGSLSIIGIDRSPDAASVDEARGGSWPGGDAPESMRLTEVRRVPLHVPYPHGVVVEPAGSLAFATYEGDAESSGGVVAVSLENGEIVWISEAGRFTLGIAYAQPG